MSRKNTSLLVQALQKRINKTYLRVFGRTPLQQRLDDILGEAIELHRYTDLANLREEAGDLLSSLLQLCNESGWSADDLIQENLAKILRRKNQYKGLGRKVKVAILGGAFDPIHSGHIAAAKFILDALGVFDEVWLQPCAAHMYGKNMAPAEDRLAMCRLAAQGNGRIKVSDYEITNDLKGETYHMVKGLLETYKDQVDPSLVIGMDNANTFHKWANYWDLERMVRFIVVPRTGEKRDPKVNWYLNPPHIYVEPEIDLPEVSSTYIRQRLGELWGRERADNKIAARTRLLQVVPYDVLSYIEKHNLYRTPKVK
jgi:nicotinate-nucleotide adenylyltransferase